jgi:UDP-N-acetylglucosamine/UDP-N-acetylgalactosamine diphosphorylase
MSIGYDTEALESRYRRGLEALKRRGQAHVLRWWDELDTTGREHLLSEIEAIPWAWLESLIQSHVLRQPTESTPAGLEPAPVYPCEPGIGQAQLYETARTRGRELLRAGRVAALTVAGGQGTRLGYDGPKGTVPVSPVREKTLFQLFAEMNQAARDRYATPIRWYIMANPRNLAQTIAFFEQHGYFGLPEDDLVFFSQEMLPVFDLHGKLILEETHRLARAPDGHGGTLKALVASGALRDMRTHGVEIISYFQVDNPLVKPFDPLFIGLHAETGSEMSTKVVRKVDDHERVGNVCLHEGHVRVVEYSDFPDELAAARNPDGSRTFDAGSIAIHLLDAEFVGRVIERQFALPYHRAEKRVAWLDENAVLRIPERPNAVKLETFVFDALPLAGHPLVLEVDRAEEFSPVKNATGVDSLETAVRHQVRRAADWLAGAGVNIPRRSDGEPDLTVEIAPSYALDAQDVQRKMTKPIELKPGDSVYLS